ncbi:MAG: hypothetical protein OHK0039_29510 [Bacteroidia bacterium]
MKIGVYVDAANINRNGGYNMKYDILKAYCAQFGTPIRLNTYLSFDKERMETDPEYRNRQYVYYSILRNFGFKVITKPVKWYQDDEGMRMGKANVDLDLAVDMLVQSRNLDKVYLLTGDGDFKRVIQAVQNMGTRVELIAFRNVSKELMFEADSFTSGYIVPNLLSMEEQTVEEWGKDGSVVRGVCYALHEGFGFIRIMMQNFTLEEVFFHFSELPTGIKPRLDDIMEFELYNSERGWQAKEIEIIR